MTSQSQYFLAGSCKLNCKHPERNVGNLHCLLSSAITEDENQQEVRVEVVTVFYPLYHPHDLDKIKCTLDEDGGGFTITEALSPFYLNSPDIMVVVHKDPEFEKSFGNLISQHMVQLNDIADNSCRQLKHTHFIFPDRCEGDTGSSCIYCNSKYWGNSNCHIESHPGTCWSSYLTRNDTRSYFVRWNFTVETSDPQIVKKMRALTIRER